MVRSRFQIEIPKRNNSCCLKGERLLPGMDYFSLLTEEATGEMKRQDFCEACWNPKLAAGDLVEKKTFWKSKIEEKKEVPAGTRGERALILLKTLLNQPDAKEGEVFVLTLLLCHMRRLILRKELHEESGRYGLYEIPHTEEFLTIKIVDLSTIETAKIQQSLAAQLGNKKVE